MLKTPSSFVQQIRNQRMKHHPTTNLPLLSATNYRIWAVGIKRLVESKGLSAFINAPTVSQIANVQQQAIVLNMLSEHCTAEYQELYFSEDLKAHEAWERIKMKLGSGNPVLGEAAKHRLTKLRWTIGSDPDLFINTINTSVKEIEYYGHRITEEYLVEILPSLVPLNHPEWNDFHRIILNSPSMDWNTLQAIFLKRAYYCNSRPENSNNQNPLATLAVAMTTKSGNNPSSWAENPNFLKDLQKLYEQYNFRYCLICRKTGTHLTEGHTPTNAVQVEKKSKTNKPATQSQIEVPAKPEKPSTAGSINSVQKAETYIAELLQNKSNNL